MSSLMLEKDPVAVKVTMMAERFVVDLEDGRSLVVPLAWYPRLLHGSEADAKIGRSLVTATPLSGPIWTNTLGSKVSWRAIAAAKASVPGTNGCKNARNDGVHARAFPGKVSD